MAKGIVKLTAEEWGKLCDALSVSPDTPVIDVIKKAEIIASLLVEARRIAYSPKDK